MDDSARHFISKWFSLISILGTFIGITYDMYSLLLFFLLTAPLTWYVWNRDFDLRW